MNEKISNSVKVKVLIVDDVPANLKFGGSRADGPFIPVNCSAVPRELAESTFFSHVKGAFSGASASHKGCFELANGGTLFLDEIGDMPLEMQPKLLRVIDDGRVTPVGGTQSKQGEKKRQRENEKTKHPHAHQFNINCSHVLYRGQKLFHNFRGARNLVLG